MWIRGKQLVSEKMAYQRNTIFLRRYWRGSHLRQFHRLAFGFEFGDVTFRRGAQLIVVNDRNENRHAKHNSDSDSNFPAGSHAVLVLGRMNKIFRISKAFERRIKFS